MLKRFKLSQRVLLASVLAVWLCGLAMGAAALWRYSGTPGTAGQAPGHWPAEAPMQRATGRATLVMLAHPHCPCTRASLAELAELMARGEAEAWVLFLRPEGAQAGWEKTDLWATAAAIPRVKLLADTDGTAARIFGAETSGHVLFYDATGALKFSGGITAGRGHQGPSAGGDAMLAALQGHMPGQEQALTFGCPLQGEEASR